MSTSSLRRSQRSRSNELVGKYTRDREHRESLRQGTSEEAVADSAGNQRTGFIPNEMLETAVLEPSRAPRDYRPYELDESGVECIGCLYISESSEDTGDAFKVLHDLIMSHNNNRCSDYQLVNIVHEFYEREVRQYSDLGPWAKQQIYEHIYYHMNDPEIQSSGNAAMLFCQIQSLRECCWSKNRESGEPSPNIGNIKLLAELIVKHQALIENKRKRVAQK
jgi:hypothetical protein